MNQRKIFVIMWINKKKKIGKIREKVFMKKLKTFQLKTTPHLINQLQLYSE